MKNYDQNLDLAQGSDSGTDEEGSIQPLTAEAVAPINTNRPTENLRKRSERIRRAVEDLLYLADADRSLILRASSAFTFSEPASGEYVISLASGDLWIYPGLTPGRQSGGRWEGGRVFCENSAAGGAWTPYSGTEGVDELVLTADRRYTGQRGYADADDYDVTTGGRSIGSNRMLVDLIADSGVSGGLGTIVATITQNPRIKITITYGTGGTPTTLANLIAFINGDRTSQGTYGVADYLRASSTGTTTNPPIPYLGGQVQGAYDAEAHQVTAAQLAAFFAVTVSGIYVNRLQEGEGLALGYPLGLVETDGTPDGGRRQSVWDLPTDRAGSRTQNTTPASGYSLFSTGREPEKIPGAIPIGKVIEGEFVFIDGTRVAVDETLELGDSSALRSVLASQVASADGALLVGYEGSGNWNADAAATTGPSLPASTISATLTRIVAHLASATSSQSGSRRIGVESIAATVSPGNADWELPIDVGSLREALARIINGVDGSGRLIGVNGRVSERGHRMLGERPLYKDFGYAGMPAGGAIFTLGQLQEPSNLMEDPPLGVPENAHLILQPLVFDDLGGGSLGVEEVATATGSTLTFPLLTMTADRFTKMAAYLPIVSDGYTGTVPLIYVRIVGLDGAADAEDGLYVVKSHNTSTRQLSVLNLDGSSPDFTGAINDVAVTLYTALAIGNDKRYAKLSLSGVTGTFAAKKPLMNVGVSYPTQPVLDIYTPDGNTGIRGLRVTPKTIELEGVELNATKVGAIQSFLDTSVDIAVAVALDFTSPLTIPVDAAAAGRTLLGVFLRITATVVSNAAGLVRYQLQLGRSGATHIPLVLTVEWTAAGADELRIGSAHAFIPMNNTTDVIATRTINTNTKPLHASARVDAVECGRLLGFS